MRVRQATEHDVSKLVELDKEAYGAYGADARYFSRKMASFPQGILVAETDKAITGFVVFELLGENDVPEDFGAMRMTEPLTGRWAHIIAFTTETNYR
ncbi:MAG: hypothetical protein HYY37_06400 [Candidatus Aenigmarchaeota archaeon]|nr:hypothetical protein [Candidatus Aenigmarchaeota archaeon]